MPQLDFREALSTPEEQLFSPAAAVPVAIAAAPRELPKISFFKGLRLSRSALTNLVFVAIASFGGLLCGFYFFNGGEVLRAAAAWPNEFLYPRPLSTDKIDIGVQPNPADYFATASSSSSGAANQSDSSAAPSAPTNLNPANPAFDATAPPPVGTAPFVPPPFFLTPAAPVVDQLTQIAPESGPYFQTLSQTASGVTTTAITTTQSTKTKLNSTRRKVTSTRPKASTTNVARNSTTKITTQAMQQSSSQTQMGMNSIQTPNQSMIGGVGGVGGMGSVGGVGGGLGGVGGLGSVGGGVGGIGVLPGHH